MTVLSKLICCSIILTAIGCSNKNQDFEAENTINIKDLEKHVIVLSSDEFQGRKPFTIGEEKTTEYIANEFKKMGIEGGYEGNYFQNVPSVELNYSPDKSITINTKNGELILENTKDYIAKTPHIKELVEIKNAEIVFAGYGIVAPEYGWDDYKNIDVKDKIVLVLVNDPGFATQNNELFKGNAMTYYGRWSYKYEEAARQGAKGVLVIHSDKAAGYGWEVLTNTSASGISIEAKDGNAKKCALEGWITDIAAKKLFEKSGLDFDAISKKAETPAFEALSLNCNLNLTIKIQLKFANSKNVVAIIKGTKRPDECIVYSALCDHFGIGLKQNGE